MMEYKRWGERLVLRLGPGEEVGGCLLEADRKGDIRLAEISGLGTASLVKLGMFDMKVKGFTETYYQGAYEIASITGNITRLNREPYLYVCMVTGSPDRGECYEGHMIRAVIGVTTEIFVGIVSDQVERKINEEIGLHLSDLQRYFPFQ